MEDADRSMGRSVELLIVKCTDLGPATNGDPEDVHLSRRPLDSREPPETMSSKRLDVATDRSVGQGECRPRKGLPA